MDYKETVVITELNPYHDECIYSQCLMLKMMGAKAVVVGNSRAEDRIRKSIDGFADELIFLPFGSGWKGLVAIIKFYRMVRRRGYVHLHFNTAQGNVAWRLFLFPFPKRLCVTGTIHNVPKLKNSLGQKIITRQINRYMLLSDLLLPTYNNICRKPVTVVYSIFYPEHDKVKIEKGKGDIWIVIPGAVSYGRRDFDSLLGGNVKYPSNIKFILLGNINRADGLTVLRKIRESGKERSFVIFNEYVPDNQFYAYVNACDYMMPLIHPDKEEYAKYIRDKISGTYNLAIAYRKPMLCPNEMQVYEDFADTAIFYDRKNLQTFFNYISTSKIDCKLFTLDKWTLEYQTKQMKRLIFNEQ